MVCFFVVGLWGGLFEINYFALREVNYKYKKYGVHMQSAQLNSGSWKTTVEQFITHHAVQNFIVFLIVLNAGLLGLETNPEITQAYGGVLSFLDHLILGIFTLEIVLLISVRGWGFFKDPWCIFDFIVVGIALVPATEALSVLRSLRVLRVLRLINKIESMRKVVGGLLHSLPGLGSVFSLILIIFYVSGVITTNEFGREFPELFGNLGKSFFTLFQVMTLESWSDSVARPVMEKFPYAWTFFVLYILIATFIVVNLFIAVIVDSLNAHTKQEDDANGVKSASELEILALKKEIIELKALIQSKF